MVTGLINFRLQFVFQYLALVYLKVRDIWDINRECWALMGLNDSLLDEEK